MVRLVVKPTAKLAHEKQAFKAKLTHYNCKKLTQFSIENDAQAQAAQQVLTTAAGGTLNVTKLEKKQRKRNPAAPFIVPLA
jgi:DNA topoisomerase-1